MYIKRNSKKKLKRKSYKTFRRCIALNLSLLSLSTSIFPYFQSAYASNLNLNPAPKINAVSIQANQNNLSLISKIMIAWPSVVMRAAFLFSKISGYNKSKSI